MAITRNIFDSRIKDVSDIQSFEQYNDKYIGKTGYFSDSLCRFQDLKCCHKFTLISINNDEEAGDFIFESEGGNYRYFLPESLLKPVKKGYRPYTINEFIKEYPLGSQLLFRPKSGSMEMHRLIEGYNDHLNGTGTLFLCGAGFSMSELYDNYEIFKDGKWKPFGIEV